jgi:DNA repair protein RadC
MKSSSGYEIYHNTLSSCLNEVESLVESKGYQVGDYFPLVNHVAYGQTERTQLEMIKNGKVANTLAIQIYRLESGRYELNCYPVRRFSAGGYTRPPYDMITSGVYAFRTKKGTFFVFSFLFERENDTEDSIQIQDDLRDELGSVIIKNSAWKRLASGKSVKARSSYNNYTGVLTRIDDVRNSNQYVNSTYDGYQNYKTGGTIKPPKYRIRTDEFAGNYYLEIEILNKGIVHLQKTKNKIGSLFSSSAQYKKLGIKPEDKIAIVEYIEVYKGYKGKGYARLLMKKAIQLAREKGWMPLYILAQPKSDNIQDLNLNDLTKFYESLGFKSLIKTRSNNIMILQNSSSKFETGGSPEDGIDLFEDYDNIPPEVQAILNEYEESFEDGNYQGLQNAKDELEQIGYTFDFYLDGEAYDLRRISGSNDSYATGGGVKSLKVGDKFIYKFDNKVYEVVSIEENRINLHNTQGKWWDNRSVTLTLMEKWLKNKSMVKTMATGGSLETYKDLSKETPLVINDSSPKIGKVPEIDLIKTGKIIDSPSIRNSDDCYTIFKKFWNENNIEIVEQLNVLFLSKANKPLGIYQHSKGGIDGTTLDIEIISAMAVKSLAKGVIIAHNHPSGALVPSEADKQMTQKLSKALNLFQIDLVDSLIITNKGYFSFADQGIMP